LNENETIKSSDIIRLRKKVLMTSLVLGVKHHY
jgi:hypothetical protein